MQPPRALVLLLIVIALVSTVGWAVSARGTATANQTAGAASEAKPHGHSGANAANGPGAHGHGGTAQNTPPMAPRDGVLAMTVPPLPKTAVNFIWKPEHLVLPAGQKVTLKVANADYMQHNFTFKAAKVAKNLPVDATTTIKLTAPAKPGLYTFYCKYHLQMMEGAVTVR